MNTVPTDSGADVNMEPADAGADVNCECVSVVREPGRDVNGTDRHGKTALMRAAEKGHGKCVSYLTKAGGNVDAPMRRRGGRTALMLAAEEGQSECVSLLFSAGADVNSLGSKERTAFLKNEWADSEGFTSHEDGRVPTALFFAVAGGHSKCVELLIAAGADVNIQACSEEETCLMKAVRKGDVTSVSALLKAGAHVNAGQSIDKTALMMAAGSRGNTRIRSLLIDAGADVNDGCRTATMYAAHHDQPECLSLLIQAGADVNKVDNFGASALIFAARARSVDCVSLLVKAGADINQTFLGWTPLMYAAQRDAESTSLLIKAGADVNKRGRDGETVVMCAAFCGSSKCLSLLVEAGADVNLMDIHGNSFLSRVQRQRALETRKRWLELLTRLDLQSQCRRFIRRHLLSVSGRNLFVTIPQLPLPERIKEFLLMAEIEEAESSASE